MIDLFKAQLVRQQALVQVSSNFVASAVLRVERFPYVMHPAKFDPQNCLAAGVRSAVVNLVNSNVGEQGRIRRNPASG